MGALSTIRSYTYIQTCIVQSAPRGNAHLVELVDEESTVSRGVTGPGRYLPPNNKAQDLD